ncbi:FtsK/SpoIIIE domain-containing protein [Clostridiisalibacter paucivorans]|uniref:FtsK/SpoIIIE domain-containing protein n=1 Tax=Clostridiisalibacter paucivorans TaxID=408753 RepID=UPI000688B15F|nr:FtsK/SpoIIIE domain-containing protein [Clostridiisalibacter paucivorans]
MADVEEQIGSFITDIFRGIINYFKSMKYGIKKIFKKEEGYSEIVGFFIFVLICAAVFLFAEEIATRISTTSKLVQGLKNPIVIKIISVLSILIYLKFKGDKEMELLNSFDEKFEAVGLYSGLKKERFEDGKKIVIKDFPKLLKVIENKEKKIYLFSTNIPVTKWRKKIEELETVMNEGILEIKNKKGNKKVVKMITVPYEIKAEKKKYDEKFENLGLYVKNDNIKKYPDFLEKIEEGKKTIFTFESQGIPIEDWKEKKGIIEATFNTNVVKIKNKKDSKNVVELTTVPLKYNIKETYPWKDEYIPEEDFEVVLGEGLLETITLNFNKTPHMLIAGLTGSGKSVLERSIAWQCIKKGAKAFFIDFKGGIELGDFEDFGEVVFERKRVMQILDSLVKEHHARIEIFKTKGAKNLNEYNQKVSEDDKLSRIFLIVDEIAELLDSSGVSKEDKKMYEEIEGKMSSLARLSRATGINMILATQRPDAKVIKGQIKNNLGARISGRMTDKEPSIMILGSPDAMHLPEDIKGRFLFSLGAEPVEFQGYWFKDTDIKKGNYDKGITLIVGDNQRAEIKDNVEIVEDNCIDEEDEETPEVKDLGYEEEEDEEKEESSPWVTVDEDFL